MKQCICGATQEAIWKPLTYTKSTIVQLHCVLTKILWQLELCKEMLKFGIRFGDRKFSVQNSMNRESEQFRFLRINYWLDLGIKRLSFLIFEWVKNLLRNTMVTIRRSVGLSGLRMESIFQQEETITGFLSSLLRHKFPLSKRHIRRLLGLRHGRATIRIYLLQGQELQIRK